MEKNNYFKELVLNTCPGVIDLSEEGSPINHLEKFVHEKALFRISPEELYFFSLIFRDLVLNN